MDTDGVKRGYGLWLLKKFQSACQALVTASGGAGGPEDFLCIFQKTKVDATLAARVWLFGLGDIPELQQYFQ